MKSSLQVSSFRGGGVNISARELPPNGRCPLMKDPNVFKTTLSNHSLSPISKEKTRNEYMTIKHRQTLDTEDCTTINDSFSVSDVDASFRSNFSAPVVSEITHPVTSKVSNRQLVVCTRPNDITVSSNPEQSMDQPSKSPKSTSYKNGRAMMNTLAEITMNACTNLSSRSSIVENEYMEVPQEKKTHRRLNKMYQSMRKKSSKRSSVASDTSPPQSPTDQRNEVTVDREILSPISAETASCRSSRIDNQLSQEEGNEVTVDGVIESPILVRAASLRSNALSYEKRQQFDQALQTYQESVRLASEAGLRKDHPVVCDTLRRIVSLTTIVETMKLSDELHVIAFQNESKGDHDEAIENYTKAFGIQKRILGDVPHPSLALTMQKIGIVHWKRGDYEDAMQHLSESLDFFLKTLDKNDPVVAETLNSIGKVHLSMGQFNMAMMHFKGSLKIRTAAYGPEHPEVARSLISIAQVFDEKGKHSRAMKHYKEALRIQKAAFGDDHVDVAATLNCIGVAHEKWGEYDLAMATYTEALWIYRSTLGNNHVDVAVTLNNTGQVHRHWGKYEEAMKDYQEALRIMKNVLGENHRNVAAIVHNIGLIYANTNKYDEAIKLFREVLKTQRAALGDEHLDLAVTLDSFGNVYEKRQKYDKALRLYNKALRVRRAALGKDHKFVAITLHRLGEFHNEKTRDKEEALRRFTEALEVYQANNIKNDHPCMKELMMRIDDVRKCFPSSMVETDRN